MLCKKVLSLTLSMAALACLGGCYSPAGGAFPRSGGSYTYRSTEFSPKSVKLVDIRTGETFFEIDVPVGKELSLDFVSGDGDDPVHTPDLMRYQIFDHYTQTGKLRNSMSVPNKYCRRIELNIRPVPEYAQPSEGEELRVDRPEDRPAYWTPEGGPMPDDEPTKAYDK